MNVSRKHIGEGHCVGHCVSIYIILIHGLCYKKILLNNAFQSMPNWLYLFSLNICLSLPIRSVNLTIHPSILVSIWLPSNQPIHPSVCLYHYLHVLVYLHDWLFPKSLFHSINKFTYAIAYPWASLPIAYAHTHTHTQQSTHLYVSIGISFYI